MKTIFVPLGTGLLLLVLTGCASTPVTLSPVGPNPIAAQTQSIQGGLEVFSRLAARSDDQNQGSTDPIWYQHTGYSIYRPDGSLMKRVQNTVGHYEQDPCVVNLPAGQYIVKAQATDMFWVKVPVTIKPGEITRVHLDGQWKPSAHGEAVVRLPDGKAVGWKKLNGNTGS